MPNTLDVRQKGETGAPRQSTSRRQAARQRGNNDRHSLVRYLRRLPLARDCLYAGGQHRRGKSQAAV
ncbi:hypothetical protein SGGMMB4_00924 [Sodalis glossinidius str. 'morsitans']|uniref:Uncharacterized protein n=1 Tax=Sodalis glossinidius (strain morsitans) TaxID=343509 RepID=A0A193QFU6_SODGM|nr:hypothetical protein SGGMMB4_00924 [Sodalis glossinidius str. 'morsitans']